jgi:hypothetical protein
MSVENPFAFDAATNLSPAELVKIYSEDFNYSRFISSKKNVFLTGDRGSGKSMTLLFYALHVRLAHKESLPKNKLFNIYVPCNTTLSHSREYELLEAHEASALSENFFVISIIFSLLDSLEGYKPLFDGVDETGFTKSINYKLGLSIELGPSFISSLKALLQRTVAITKRQLLTSISQRAKSRVFDGLFSFYGHAVPLIDELLTLPSLKDGHFSLMIDDAQYLNDYQSRKLNTWILHRDHSQFSFKIASTKTDMHSYQTEADGCIVEGQDFTAVDMENPEQNRNSDFGKLARNIMAKRLARAGIETTVDNFFPMNTSMVKDLGLCEKEARAEAEGKFGEGPKKQITDYVYKYTRAKYFKGRSSKSNRPPYSGFETLVHLSTGVVRNLLEPCFWMYESAYASINNKERGDMPVKSIPSSIQTKTILDQSLKKWDWIQNGIDKSDSRCTKQQAKHIYQLLDNIAILFRERLLDDISEPRAVMFSISEKTYEHYDALIELINIASRSQLIYLRSGNAKDDGKSEIYYVLNKILLPLRGLDPVGQHARVSIRASHLYKAATENTKIPYKPTVENHGPSLLDII